MALLGAILALVAIATAAPASNYIEAQWNITFAYGLDSFPVVGGNFTLSNVDTWPCDPLDQNVPGNITQAEIIQDGTLSAVQLGFWLMNYPLSPPPVSAITMTGTLMIQSSAVGDSLTSVTFPDLSLSIAPSLNRQTMDIGGTNCSPNGEAFQIVCAGVDADGTSISAIIEHDTGLPSDNPSEFKVMEIRYNAE